MEGGSSKYEEQIETEKLLEEIQALLARIIETGPSLDPALLGQLTQQLQLLLESAGLLNSQGILDTYLLDVLSAKVAESKYKAVPPDNYPAFDDFRQVIDNNSDIFSVDRRQLSARGAQSLELYLYELGIVMSNRYVYEAIFKDDPIEYAQDRVHNGRHRFLTKEVLRLCGYPVDAWTWVEIVTPKRHAHSET